MHGEVIKISRKEAVDFLHDKHYSGRDPVTSFCFGWVIEGELSAVCTFGKPASHSLCIGVCGKDWSGRVYELNRLCAVDNMKGPISCFVSACLRELKSMGGYIVVSYSDTAMKHNGYIYQACNFLYTGATKRRTDKYTEGNKHSRHYDKDAIEVYRKVRSAKHRYVYFAMGKAEKKKALKDLKYPIMPYPKGENSRYVLGEFLEPEIIKVTRPIQ